MPRGAPPPEKRFWTFAERSDSGCLLWAGARTANGYGRFKMEGRTVMAHRAAYQFVKGAIPEGLTVDHLCRVRHCVEPGHLEAVTMRTNVLRGETITAANAEKSQCLRGHPLAGSNLFVRSDGRRRCRACERATQKRLRSSPEYRTKHAAYERLRRARSSG